MADLDDVLDLLNLEMSFTDDEAVVTLQEITAVVRAYLRDLGR